MVFRGGYGLNYNQEQIANANNNDGNPPGTSSVPGSSTGPTNINPNILYAVSSSPTNIYGYPANPNTITTFNSAGLPRLAARTWAASRTTCRLSIPSTIRSRWSIDLGHCEGCNLGYVGS